MPVPAHRNAARIIRPRLTSGLFIMLVMLTAGAGMLAAPKAGMATGSGVAYAAASYLSTDEFLERNFKDGEPEAKALWLKKPHLKVISNIMGVPFNRLRIRYWTNGSRTVWILSGIGKTKPITAGFGIENGQIEDIVVLKYLESRGWEIRHSFFTDQFKRLSLLEGNQLNRSVDGISGATLSVSAMTRMARVALYLASQIEQNKAIKDHE